MASKEKLPVHGWKSASPNRPFRRRMPQKSFFLIVSLVLIFFFWLLHRDEPVKIPPRTKDDFEHQETDFNRLPGGDLPCRKLPGADDVLVVMRTGSTELQDKLPIHLTTTLRCYPHHMVFSDYEEDYHGEHILDALESVDPVVKQEHPDFELWRRLRDHGGRSALRGFERSGPISHVSPNTGKANNPGWKIDKWKFLPMVNRTLHEYPDMKWYLFVETDTYVFWQTMLNYLAALDATKPIYMGGQIWIGDVLFAHGGTGFVVSNPGMQKVVQHFNEHKKEWEDYTNWHWAGDCVLGKAFKDAGSPLTMAWPIWQADDIGNMNYARTEGGTRLWCKPTVSYHHLSPSVVEDLWEFEQDWIEQTNGDTSKILHHKDVYHQYILPRVREPRRDWDNHADTDEGPVHSLDACRAICAGNGHCMQYALSTDLRCLTTDRPNLGEVSRGVDSGWMYDRMESYYDDAKWCLGGDGWIT